jgi:exodeoxyribonuclease V gamma subunit
MGHGVTFCGMVPMRSIPFSVVCLIGMNDEVFPRRQPMLSFDLLSQDHREGDRSRRDDDRYLFLEALLSAQQTLYISYVGASIVDNSEVPPSVLISDLQDLLCERFETQDGADILTQIKTQHPLQPFSKRYFDGDNPKLFSFNAAQCPLPDSAEQLAWFDTELEQADSSWRDLSAGQLARFFAHPIKFLLRERLNIRLELEEEELDSREPFALDSLESWNLRQQLLEANLTQFSDEGLKPVIAAMGILPQGELGEAWFEQESATVTEFIETLAPNLPEAPPISVAVDVQLDGFRLGGQLEGISQQGLLRYRLAKRKGKDIVAAWIDHLLLNIVRPEGVQLETKLLLQDTLYQFLPVTSPTQILSQLLALYWQGLHQPLPFFDKTSLEYFQLSEGKNPEQALAKAEKIWLGSGQLIAEQDDPYHQLVYKQSPLDDDFIEIAKQVYLPIVTHLQGGEL